jgi:hypothetical protein
VAGFHLPITGWFCAPTDSLVTAEAEAKALLGEHALDPQERK